jgi:hypothetical protein
MAHSEGGGAQDTGDRRCPTGLGVRKRLADTLIVMLHYGMVRRVGEGRYVVA